MKFRTIYKENDNNNNHVRLLPVFFPMGRGSGVLWVFWLFLCCCWLLFVCLFAEMMYFLLSWNLKKKISFLKKWC